MDVIVSYKLQYIGMTWKTRSWNAISSYEGTVQILSRWSDGWMLFLSIRCISRHPWGSKSTVFIAFLSWYPRAIMLAELMRLCKKLVCRVLAWSVDGNGHGYKNTTNQSLDSKLYLAIWGLDPTLCNGADLKFCGYCANAKNWRNGIRDYIFVVEAVSQMPFISIHISQP